MSTRSAFGGLPALLLAGFLGLTGLAACDSGPSGDVVAEAGDYALGVDEAVSLMRAGQGIPNNEEVVRLVADLWIDYTLLAESYQQDSTFESFDVSTLVRTQLDQDLLLAYRDSMVEADTVFTEEELRAAFEDADQGVQLRARHILLSFPDNATEAQRDSVEALAREIRQRVDAGEDFAALAQEYSDDPGSAARGGALGTFGRGRMVPSFEEAAFDLGEGEISEPVESPYGLHIIQVQERITQDFEANREQFEQQQRARATFEAESVFIAGLEEEAGLELEEGAIDIARALAADPGELPPGADRDDALVSYQGGALTVGEYQDFIRTRPASERSQIEGATTQQIEGAVMNLSRRDLLLQRAREAGMELAEARGDTLRERVRANLRQAARQLDPPEGVLQETESQEAAIETTVMDVLTQTLQGARAPLQLGGLSFVLRDPVEVEIHDEGVQEVLRRLQEASTPGAGGDASTGAG
ncbi:MAG: peptidylprolyl isomerase, partial [Longimicrobiales bacterium]|nr:peptidylprolyl isomerase [Longimicrobiales bacterium]